MKRIALTVTHLAIAFLAITAMVQDRPRNPPIERLRSIEADPGLPPRVRDILRRACYDCHSYETRWPWYSRVPMIAGRMGSDVSRGRAAMNFSDWKGSAGASPAHASATLTAACAAVRTGIMPKPPYPYMHPEARLSAADIDSLCAWTREQSARLRAQER